MKLISAKFGFKLYLDLNLTFKVNLIKKMPMYSEDFLLTIVKVGL